jgi:hypothetical protein
MRLTVLGPGGGVVPPGGVVVGPSGGAQAESSNGNSIGDVRAEETESSGTGSNNSGSRKGGRRQSGKRAVMALGGGWQADLDFADFAFDSASGSERYAVGVAAGGQGGKTVTLLTFPYFPSTLYYDPGE